MSCSTQNEAVNKLSGLKVGALFMDMGSGKTKTILDIYTKKRLSIDIVFISPSSVLKAKTIHKEFEKWHPQLLQRTHFFTSESVSQSNNKFMEIHNLLNSKECFLVLDESIKFKNSFALRTQRLFKIAHLAKYRFILNGTPITRSILDILAQMDFLSPRILNMSEAQFANHFLIYRLDSGEKAPWRSWSKPYNEKALMKLIEPYIVETSLNIDVGITYIDYDCRLNNAEKEAYNDFKSKVLSRYHFNFLTIAQSFQHFYTFSQQKFNIIKNIDCKNTLFFVKFKKWFNILPTLLNSDNVGIYNAEHKDDLSKFSTAIVTYGCGSYGLNLQHFKRVVFIDATFDYGNKIQALSRVKRLGQTNNIEVINLWCNTGLEDIIKQSLDKKCNTLTHIKSILKSMDRVGLESL